VSIGTGISGTAITLGHGTSEVTVADNLTVSGNLTVTGTTTSVDSTTINVTNAFIFEGATADAHETTLGIIDPTADATINLPAMSAGTYYLPVLAAATTTSVTSTPAELNLLDGSSANSVVNSKAVIYGSSGEVTASSLTVDDVAVNGKVITMTGSSGDTAVFTVGANGTLSLVTVDTAAAAANIQITADGTVDIDSAGVLTLDSGAAINIEPAAGSAVLIDGNVSIDGDAVTGIATLAASGVITAGGFTIGSAAILEAELEILDGATVTTTELNLLDALDRGSILYGNASSVTTILGQGNTDQVLTSDGTDIAWQDAAGGPTEATAQNIEDEITGTYYAPPDLIKHSPGVAKMWIQLDGTGTIADNGSYNCGTLTDNAVGDYTVAIDVPMTDTGKYVMVAFAESPNVSDDAAGPNLDYMRVRTQDANDNLIDVNRLYLALFGDQ